MTSVKDKLDKLRPFLPYPNESGKNEEWPVEVSKDGKLCRVLYTNGQMSGAFLSLGDGDSRVMYVSSAPPWNGVDSTRCGMYAYWWEDFDSRHYDYTCKLPCYHPSLRDILDYLEGIK